MKVAYNDLISLLSEKPTKALLSEKLFQLGHEHEIHDDIFDMELTPNRGDCLSLRGLARDLNIFFGNSMDFDIYEGKIEELKIDFENLSPSDCPKISFLEIEITESVDTYMPYLENFFNVIGNKKTNFFTDISNYISYELGQPTHCYDRKAIENKLVFEKKECEDSFKTLLDSEIKLKDQNCIFSMNGNIISLAGVMGGASTACTTETKKALIECAFFNPESIIGKSIKYNLVSDAAHKFERGVDIASQEHTLRRFIKVVQDHTTIKSIKFKTFSQVNYENSKVPLDVQKLNTILGTELDESECVNYLKGLGFGFKNEIEIPSYRHDIKTDNDLAEEIARSIGYNNIKNAPINLQKIDNSSNLTKLKKLELFLSKNGFFEVINFPFTSNKGKKSVIIDNPLYSNKNNLRISLKDSLLENLLYNERRQQDSIKLFEVSDVYIKNPKIEQNKKIGIIVSGRVANNYRDFSKKLDFKYLNQLLNGRLSKDIFNIIEISRNDIDTKKKDKIFYVEICIDKIPDEFFSDLSIDIKTIKFVRYKPVSEYPSSTRDFSFSIDNAHQVNKVIGLLDGVSDSIIKDSFIFDFYRNNKTNTFKLGYRFIFQSHLKTLSDLEINKKIKEIITPVLNLEGVTIPGMIL